MTSASERIARHRLDCAGLPLPNLLVGAEAVVNGKPDPEPYLLGSERLGVLTRSLSWYLRMPRPVSRAP